MNNEGADKDRRRFLTAAATVVGGAGAVAAAVPFISTLTPSAKARAIGAPVEIDLSDLKPGGLKIEQWQGKPIWILRRSEEDLQALQALDDSVRDPDSEVQQQPEYASNEYRSIKPEYLIVVGLCTHLGCSPSYIRKGDDSPLGDDWQGGFFCPCHGSKFDLAGRVFQGVPAPANLLVPPHKYLSDTRVLVGDDSGVG
ncbi:MAG: ubiquinol-cytochrome c reductase iron-sulfur subunit [Gammaproteobacteria bacterium]|nr:ubiquinol-cytochrome c reductase iron-sulfur subunit [Gammaproteobacteria bacterium]